MSKWRRNLDWATNAILSPRQVAALKPTGREAAERICAGVEKDALVDVEFGPGTGSVTDVLRERLGEDATIILIEINRGFAKSLRRTTQHDPRVSVCEDSAVNVRHILRDHGLIRANHVISGIPFSVIPKATSKMIVGEAAHILLPGGTFIAYQIKDAVRTLLTEEFLSVKEEIVPELPQNYLLYTATKED